MEGTGLLAKISDILASHDFLLQLNSLELLTGLALTTQGQKYLETSGVIARLNTMLLDCPNLPFADILLPGMISTHFSPLCDSPLLGLVKFWGNVAHLRPREVLLKYPAIVTTLANMVQSDDPTAQTVALETLGYIGVSLEGKSALLESGNMVTECVDKLTNLIHHSTTELKITALNALASLVKLDKENQSLEMLSVTESWFRRSPDLIVSLTELLKQPFLDLRYKSYPLTCHLTPDTCHLTPV